MDNSNIILHVRRKFYFKVYNVELLDFSIANNLIQYLNSGEARVSFDGKSYNIL